jgi:hypothetical protein
VVLPDTIEESPAELVDIAAALREAKADVLTCISPLAPKRHSIARACSTVVSPS